MRIALSRRPQSVPADAVHLLEIVTPRTNMATLTSAENFFASIAAGEPLSVELAADSGRRRFLVRTASEQMRDQALSQLGAAYPQADFRQLSPDQDPALLRPGEQLAACTLHLRAQAYLPLRTFTDLDIDGERAAQADPMLGILNALGDLPSGWRCMSQMVVRKAPEDWCRGYQRKSVQQSLEHERVPRPSESAGPLLAFMAGLLAILLVGLEAISLARTEQWLHMALLGLATAGSLAGGVFVVRRLVRPTLYDMDLVREKITRIACYAELRLVVFAPVRASPARVSWHLERIAAVYRRFNLAAANGFVPRRATPKSASTQQPIAWSNRRLAVLTTLELAGVWHLPHSSADVALLERTSARRWLPLPEAVADGCRIGTSRHQGHQIPVALPRDVLHRHQLLVAKTRRGKSTLMQRMAQYAMQVEPGRGMLLVDPHRDLAESLLGLVPPDRRADVIYLDVANRDRPFGLNLLDTGLGWDRDRAVSNTLAVFQREWGDRYWGPRMEDAFRYSLMTLFEANLALSRCSAAPALDRQYTLLDIPTILSDTLFRRELLSTLDDPTICLWWSDYFEPLERRLQLEVINPVLTKIHRFEGNTPARQIVGQPISTIDPSAWLRDGAIVIVNTARGTVGENAAGLIGSTLLNLMTLAVAEQAGLPPQLRRSTTIFVDEFHTIPGADYESILAELNKYGANLVLATQSLARLLALGREEGAGLRATVFANLDGLFAFNCSAEDAEYLVPELGGAIDEQDLMELGEHQCYVRLSSAGKRLPTFWVHLDPPEQPDSQLGAALIQQSAERFGRNADLVEADRRADVSRILEARTRHLARPLVQSAPEPATEPKPKARNDHRPRKKQHKREPVDVVPA
jgi:hypothetical protein